jgi:DNA primase
MGASGQVVDAVLEIAKEQPKKRKTEFFNFKTEHVLNESLLGVFDYCPVPLVEAGFDEKLLQQLDIGFDKQQLRITFPIRDLYGRLVGIAGRTVVDEMPRYKVYKSEDVLPYAPDDPEVEGRYRRYDIKSHYHLWNMHNVYPEAFFGSLDTLVIVEGYKACLWCLQNGIGNCVAIQGSWLSRQQEAILRRLRATFILLLDNNAAGRKGSYIAGARLQRYGRTVLVCEYPRYADEQAQPDDLSQEQLIETLDSAERFNEWRSKPWNAVYRDIRRSDST